MMPFVDLAAQRERLGTAIEDGIARVMAHGLFILGPEVAELEERLAVFAGARHCITCANGTDALQIALMALGVGPGDEVVMPSFSYFATAEAAVLLGARPVFVDIEQDTCNIDPGLVEAAITERTRAIIPVSLYGQCADLDAINAIAARYDLSVIEDGAQSFGATLGGRRSCSMTTIGCTSFFPSKPLGCYGDGGAMFTDDDHLAVRLRQIARHGQDRRYHHIRIGVNSRLDTMQAAVLLAKLDVFEEELERRDEAAAVYSQLLADCDAEALPMVREGRRSAWAQYTVRVANRDRVAETLKHLGIPTAVHYPLTLAAQPALSAFGGAVLPRSEHAARTVLSLPMHPDLTTNDIERVSSALRTVLAAERASCSPE